MYRWPIRGLCGHGHVHTEASDVGRWRSDVPWCGGVSGVVLMKCAVCGTACVRWPCASLRQPPAVRREVLATWMFYAGQLADCLWRRPARPRSPRTAIFHTGVRAHVIAHVTAVESVRESPLTHDLAVTRDARSGARPRARARRCTSSRRSSSIRICALMWIGAELL